MHYTIHADGGARGNPGPAGAGAIIRDELGNSVGAVSEFLGHRTNNYAEYEAVILAFETLTGLVPKGKYGVTTVEVKMDSMLVVRQMQGAWKIKHPTMKEKQARLAQLVLPWGSVMFTHVRREQNKDADALANEAMDAGR